MATLYEVANKNTKGTVIVASGDPRASSCTVTSGKQKDVQFPIGDSTTPLHVFFHGKTGNVDWNGVLILLSFDLESGSFTACLGCDPTGTLKKSSTKVEIGNTYMKFVENESSLKMIVSTGSPAGKVALDFDVLVPSAGTVTAGPRAT